MTVLLERDAELAALDAACVAALAGHGTLVLLAGEAGIGKTALVRAFASTAGAPVHVGSCEPLAVPAPLAPLHDIAATLGPPLCDALARAADAPAVARTLLESLAARGPAVVVLEDVHWADAATLDVLRVAARRAERVAAVLLLTYRDDGAPGEPVRVLAGELASSASLVRLTPRRLSAAAVLSLAAGGRSRGPSAARGDGRQPVSRHRVVGRTRAAPAERP
ncbi:MAG: ATP-binding protein [Gaiellaceae bacterium]